MSRLASEWLLLRRDRTVRLVYVLFAVLAVFAASESVAAFRREERVERALVTEEEGRLAELRRALDAPTAGPTSPWTDPGNPGAVGGEKGATYALLPLVDLAVLRGHGDRPTTVSVSTGGGALDRAEGDLIQPHVESLGRFDLFFLILVVVPLVAIVLSFDVVVRDRESGVLRLLAAQDEDPRARYRLRVALREAPLVSMTFLAVAAAVTATGRMGPGAVAGLTAALVAIGLYVTFWAAAMLALQSWVRTATASGVAGLAVWSAVSVLVPTVAAATAEASAPIPSRIERTSATREATRRASIEAKNVLSRYLDDHPDLAGAQANPSDYYVRRVAVAEAVAAERAPVEERFLRATARRQEVARVASMTSPVRLVAATLDELAGSSVARDLRFRRDVDAFQRRFAAFFDTRTMRGERLSSTALEERPTFRFRDEPPATWPLLELAAWTAFALVGARARMRRALDLEGVSGTARSDP